MCPSVSPSPHVLDDDPETRDKLEDGIIRYITSLAVPYYTAPRKLLAGCAGLRLPASATGTLSASIVTMASLPTAVDLELVSHMKERFKTQLASDDRQRDIVHQYFRSYERALHTGTHVNNRTFPHVGIHAEAALMSAACKVAGGDEVFCELDALKVSSTGTTCDNVACLPLRV